MPTPWTYSAGGEYAETLEFLTEVLPGRTGPPQHRRLRERPRTIISFDVLEEGDRRRMVEDALVGNGNGEWYVPLLVDSVALDYTLFALPLPDRDLDFTTTDRRFWNGGQVLLMAQDGDPRRNDPREYSLGQATLVWTAGVTIAPAPEYDWPAGSLVLPLVRCKLVSAPTVSRFTGDSNNPFRVSFRVLDEIEMSEDLGADYYRELPVLEWAPNWGESDPPWTPDHELLTVDNGSGPIVEYDPTGVALVAQRGDFTVVGRDRIWQFRELLYALGGRWAAFWLPTWAQDFRVVSLLEAGVSEVEGRALQSGSNKLYVAWTGISTHDLKANRRDLRIELRNGLVHYRRIVAAEDWDGSIEELTLDSNWPANVLLENVVLVSFLSLAHQDSDVNVMRFWTAEVMECELSFRGFYSDEL